MAARIVVMGVSGCGKSSVARSLAERLGARFIEGDELHSRSNVAKMAAGVPLDDADRQGWLEAVGTELAATPTRAVVAACSALKRRYRDQLRAAAPGLRFVFLHGEPALLAARMAAREGHYMPAALLQSQLDTLEPPQGDEQAMAFAIDQPVEQIVAAAEKALAQSP